jgi:hypothetical protein
MASINEGRDRLTAMIDRMMDRCAPIAGLALRPGPAIGRRP